MSPGFTITVENGKLHLEVRDAQGLRDAQQEWIEKIVGLVAVHFDAQTGDDEAVPAQKPAVAIPPPSTEPMRTIKARFRNRSINNDTEWMRAAKGRSVTLLLPATEHPLDGMYVDGAFDDGGGPFWGIRENRFEVKNEHGKMVTLNLKTHLKNR